MKYKYSEDELKLAVLKSDSVSGVMKLLGIKLTGSNHSHLTKKMKKLEIDFSHFKGKNNSHGGNNKKTPEEVLVISTYDNRHKGKTLTAALIGVGRIQQCSECGIGNIWNNKPIVLHVDHIDGNWKNNLKENLRFLCPNCHSQTDNYGIKNKGNMPA